MIRDDAIALIKQGLGFRSDLDAQILTQMKFEQEVLERKSTLPWFLLSEFSNINTVIGEERLPVPTDFLQEYEEGTLWWFDSTATAEDQWTQLGKALLDEVKTAEPGTPDTYVVTGPYFRLFPVPDAVYNMKMVYYKQGVVLDNNVENEWLKYASDWLMALTGLHMAEDIENDKAAAKFQQRVVLAEDRIARENEARKHTNVRYIMGGED